MPDLIDPVNASLLAQGVAADLRLMGQSHAFVSEQARLSHLRADKEISTREATAMQEVRTSAQAREILQANAAAPQPITVNAAK